MRGEKVVQHGANIYKYAKIAKTKPKNIIDFSSNINCYQPKKEITCSSKKIAKYPNSNYPKLKKTIAKKYKLKTRNIALYNGATSAIYALFNALKEKRVYLYAPLYGEYEKAAKLYNKEIIKINRFENIDAKIKPKSIVVFVNPSTPDGRYYDLRELFAYWKKQECVVVLDESFLEFEDLGSLKKEIQNYAKLYIIQSFTKFYACAGVRVGAIFSDTKSIQKLHQPLWNLSTLDEHFLKERLNDKAFSKKAKKVHQKQKKELENILKNSKLFDKIIKSDANFILTHTKEHKKLFKHLLKQKILVRTCGSFDYLSDAWFRFAVKDKKAHKKLEEALLAYYKANS